MTDCRSAHSVSGDKISELAKRNEKLEKLEDFSKKELKEENPNVKSSNDNTRPRSRLIVRKSAMINILKDTVRSRDRQDNDERHAAQRKLESLMSNMKTERKAIDTSEEVEYSNVKRPKR